MSRKLPQAYEIVTFDEEGTALTKEHLLYSSHTPAGFKQSGFNASEEREVHFQAIQREVTGAVDHRVRMMQPRETQQYLRKVRREAIKDEVIANAMQLIGIHSMIELLPVTGRFEQPRTGDAHLARG